ncbi:hypothetical protein ACVIOG_007363 [Rhizobium leguminosarum]
MVQISTIFGRDPDYWTLALLGTDQHAMPSEFEIIGQVEPAERSAPRQAAEQRLLQLTDEPGGLAAGSERTPNSDGG